MAERTALVETKNNKTSSVWTTRLMQERKSWRKDHPYGFFARPLKDKAGKLDLSTWECGIPGPTKTDWEGGLYKIEIIFPENYPAKPPKCKFTPPLFHPNVYPSGTVCLSILNESDGAGGWRPGLTIPEVLLGIQTLLNEPNINSPAQTDAYQLFRTNKVAYSKKIKEIANENHASLQL